MIRKKGCKWDRKTRYTLWKEKRKNIINIIKSILRKEKYRIPKEFSFSRISKHIYQLLTMARWSLLAFFSVLLSASVAEVVKSHPRLRHDDEGTTDLDMSEVMTLDESPKRHLKGYTPLFNIPATNCVGGMCDEIGEGGSDDRDDKDDKDVDNMPMAQEAQVGTGTRCPPGRVCLNGVPLGDGTTTATTIGGRPSAQEANVDDSVPRVPVDQCAGENKFAALPGFDKSILCKTSADCDTKFGECCLAAFCMCGRPKGDIGGRCVPPFDFAALKPLN